MPSVSRLQARRFLLRIQGITTPFASIEEALRRLAYVQIDPINVSGRMHDLILRNRVEGYAENGLHEYLHHPSRPGFEYYLPGAGILVAFPMEAWPYVLPHMESRRSDPRGYSGKLDEDEEALATDILAEIKATGRLTSDAIRNNDKSTTAWGNRARMAKVVLEKLFVHGRVVIAERNKFRRIYDLPERVIPPEALARPPADPVAISRWLLHARLRQRRLTTLSKKDLPLIEDLVVPVSVEDCPPLFILREDLPVWEEAIAKPPNESLPRLLAPLDPLIYDRRLTARLWDFDYTWEVYTPAAKRVRGYYALPLLSDEALVGHVDLKANRKAGKLEIVSRRIARGHRFAPAVKELSRFLGLR